MMARPNGTYTHHASLPNAVPAMMSSWKRMIELASSICTSGALDGSFIDGNGADSSILALLILCREDYPSKGTLVIGEHGRRNDQRSFEGVVKEGEAFRFERGYPLVCMIASGSDQALSWDRRARAPRTHQKQLTFVFQTVFLAHLTDSKWSGLTSIARLLLMIMQALWHMSSVC